MCHDIFVCDLSVTCTNVDPSSPFPDEGRVPNNCEERVVKQVIES